MTEKKLLEQKPEPVEVCRLSHAGFFYFQNPKKDPLQLDITFSRELKGKDQPWIREHTVDEKGIKLEYGWLKNPGTVVIVSEKESFSVIPTSEELEKAKEKILIYKYAESSQGELIYPGETKIINPTDPHSLIVSSKKGSVDFTLYAFTE